MHSYTKLALDWLADHPNPETVTSDPHRWAEQTSQSIRQRIHELVDQLAPPTPDQPFLSRVQRLNSGRQTATEVAIDEHLPNYEPTPEEPEAWTPLVPDISDLL